MVRRMPILRHHHIGEGSGDPVDHRDDLVAVLYRQPAARQEAVLHVDHNEGGRSVRFDLVSRHCLPALSDQGVGQYQTGEPEGDFSPCH
jgi:hypothetical protein